MRSAKINRPEVTIEGAFTHGGRIRYHFWALDMVNVAFSEIKTTERTPNA